MRQENVVDDGDEPFRVALQFGLLALDGLGEVVGDGGDDALGGLRIDRRAGAACAKVGTATTVVMARASARES